jgi:large subunit ribosomal protein L18
MKTKLDKRTARAKRHRRVRKKVFGASDRHRLCVFRSLKHIYAQIADDTKGVVLCSASSMSPELKSVLKSGGNVEAAKAVGKLLAEKSKEKGIERVVFDRGGYPYHGRIKALSEGAREGGLIF